MKTLKIICSIILIVLFSNEVLAQKKNVKIFSGGECRGFTRSFGTKVFIQNFTKDNEYSCVVRKTKTNLQTNEVVERKTVIISILPKDKMYLGCSREEVSRFSYVTTWVLVSKKIVGKYKD